MKTGADIVHEWASGLRLLEPNIDDALAACRLAALQEAARMTCYGYREHMPFKHYCGGDWHLNAANVPEEKCPCPELCHLLMELEEKK